MADVNAAVRFNTCQREAVKESFAAARRITEERYEAFVRGDSAKAPHYGSAEHWDAIRGAMDGFHAITDCICAGGEDSVDIEDLRGLMFLMETAEHNDCGAEDRRVILKGLRLLVGLFRNRFPGEKWNPDGLRWTTVGDPGARGVSPMLMAIAEL